MPGMKDFPIPAGTRFGNLTVLGPAPKKGAHARFTVKCNCSAGTMFAARGATLRDGRTNRCKKCAAKASVDSRNAEATKTVNGVPVQSLPHNPNLSTVLDQFESDVKRGLQLENEQKEIRQRKELARKLLAG